MKSFLVKSFLAALFFLCIGLPATAEGLISAIHTDKARYSPKTAVRVRVTLTSPQGKIAVTGTIRLLPQHLETTLPSPPPQRFQLPAGTNRTFVFLWKPPLQNFQGYRVEAQVRSRSGLLLGNAATAVDVSSTWTRFPRYGFLSAYPRQSRATSRREVETLKDYHLNAIQFYDWQWKHQQPLSGTLQHPAADWNDIANRPISRQTVLDCLDAAHDAGMAAMNYNLLYGAWHDGGRGGVSPHWGLFNDTHGTQQDSLPMPEGWATSAIDLYNPADPNWQDFLIQREAEVFAAYPFDGWQVDQVGERGLKYDSQGQPVIVWKTFRPFLNRAKARLQKAILFNNVGGYGLYDTASQSTEEAVYVECWPDSGQKTYADLKTVLDQASAWSGGKAVILAAYLNYRAAQKASSSLPERFNLPGVLLADAAIFAAGGAHIELGDSAALLDSEYFPNHNLRPDPALLLTLADYYDFLTAYENLLRGSLQESHDSITLNGAPLNSTGAPNTVWGFAKTGHGYHMLQLINLVGEHNTAWRDDNADYPAPTRQANLIVRYHTGKQTVAQVHWASPDADHGATHPLMFTRGTDASGKYVQFTVPSLIYWDIVYFTDAASA